MIFHSFSELELEVGKFDLCLFLFRFFYVVIFCMGGGLFRFTLFFGNFFWF